MAMKNGCAEEFAEIANEIRRLVVIAYPTLGRGMRETLVLDQFNPSIECRLSAGS